jgi:hypothetical protein
VSDPEDFDDLPETHLDDEDYEAFLERELDAQGRPKGPAPVTTILIVVIVAVLALAFVLLRG